MSKYFSKINTLRPKRNVELRLYVRSDFYVEFVDAAKNQKLTRGEFFEKLWGIQRRPIKNE